MKLKKTGLRWIPLVILLIFLLLSFYFHLYDYLSFAALKQHRQELLQWTSQYYIWTVIGYMLIYQLAVAVSIPGALLLTLVGGFLFGIFPGTLYVVISATLGATWLFLAVNLSLGNIIAERSEKWVNKMRAGFNKNAFNYLLVLRLIPIFPFWVVNIVPALLGVRLKTFFFATLIGIIPGSFVYVLLGNSLGTILDAGKKPNLSIIFQPHVLLPLLALALLSLLPVFYKWLKGNNHVTQQ